MFFLQHAVSVNRKSARYGGYTEHFGNATWEAAVAALRPGHFIFDDGT